MLCCFFRFHVLLKCLVVMTLVPAKMHALPWVVLPLVLMDMLVSWAMSTRMKSSRHWPNFWMPKTMRQDGLLQCRFQLFIFLISIFQALMLHWSYYAWKQSYCVWKQLDGAVEDSSKNKMLWYNVSFMNIIVLYCGIASYSAHMRLYRMCSEHASKQKIKWVIWKGFVFLNYFSINEPYIANGICGLVRKCYLVRLYFFVAQCKKKILGKIPLGNTTATSTGMF